MPSAPPQPPPDCVLCPRLVAFREAQRNLHPDWHNAPVPSFGPTDARLLIVGLAPGLKGANRTGRPFTGDHAGDLLYATLRETGFALGEYRRDPADGLTLVDCRIANAVRCVPPANKPLPGESANCRRFLAREIAALPQLRALLALGRIAHESVLAAFALRASAWPFAHAAMHVLPNGLTLADSYHCSRQNTNTGRLTPEMFRSVFIAVRERLAAPVTQPIARPALPAAASPSG